MKKGLLAVLAQAIALVAAASAGVVRPIEKYFDLDNLPNGEYAVSFSPSSIVSDSKGVSIEFEIFSIDIYDGKLLSQLAVGDHVITSDGYVEVNTIDFDEYGIVINEITNTELYLNRLDNGNYVVCGPSNQATYTSHGVTRLLISPSATLRDDGINGNPLASKTVKGKQVPTYLRNSWSNEFDELSTTIVIKNGRVRKIHRTYVP